MKAFRILSVIPLLLLFVFISGCEKASDEQTTCQNDQLLFDFTTQLSKGIEESISFYREHDSPFYRIYMEDVAKLNTEDKIAYYKTVQGGYQPSFSSLWTGAEERIYSIEYYLSLDSELSKMDSRMRREVLSMAIEKHRKKFGEEYVTPFSARRSGILLILSILQYENAYFSLDKICGYCTKYNIDDSEGLSVNEDFNQFLVKTASEYLFKKN